MIWPNRRDGEADALKIAIIGSGYVGLVAGACLADYGHRVVCVDTDESKIRGLNNGIVPIYEPGLAELIETNRHADRLSFSTRLAEALDGASAAFIAVGTPTRAGDGQADLSFVHAVANDIAARASSDLVVVNKSTVPVGTADAVARILLKAGRPVRFSVASNPEFMREGVAIRDFMKPDRIVIGADDEWARGVLCDIYRVEGFAGVPVVCTSTRSAELLKYAANAFLAMKITFINEIADLCEAVGASIDEVSCGVGLDRRIGAEFLRPGPGYGGSCFPKDTLALTSAARAHGLAMRTVESVIGVNEQRKRDMALKIINACGGSVRDKKVAVLGLAFKADTDDMRESPAVPMVQALQEAGAEIQAYDPESMENAKPLLPGARFCADAYAAAEDAEVLVIATEWKEFAALNLPQLHALMKTPVIVDLRNILPEKDAFAAGFGYFRIGRGDFPAASDRSIPEAAE